MSLFNSNRKIILIKRNSLQLWTNEQQPQQLMFPPEAIKHQEIIERRLFEKIITDFFTKFKKCEGVIFLDNDIIFQKQLPLTASTEESESFYSSIPFSQHAIAKKMIRTTQYIYLFAVNRDLYETIVFIAKQHQCEIKEVLPVTIFLSYLQGKEISYATLSQALEHKNFIDVANFLKEENTEKKVKTQTNTTSLKQYLILVVSILFLLIVLAFATINLGLLPLK